MLKIFRLCCTSSVLYMLYVLKPAEHADFSTISTFVNLLMTVQVSGGSRVLRVDAEVSSLLTRLSGATLNRVPSRYHRDLSRHGSVLSGGSYFSGSSVLDY